MQGERRRGAIVSAGLVAVLTGAIALALGIGATSLLLRPSPDPVAIGEHLLGPLAAKDLLRRAAADLPPRLSVPKNMSGVIHRAARTVGFDVGYLITVAERESAFDPLAHAEGSSALGLYQFTTDTWLRVVKVFGDRHGLGRYAQQIAVGSDGQVSMPDRAARAALLQLRTDPHLATLMAAELARDNQARLERLLGRKVTPAETYVAHFLGVTQGAQFIAAARAPQPVSGVRLLPVAAARNQAVFSPAGRDADAAEIVGRIDAYFEREVPRFTRM